MVGNGRFCPPDEVVNKNPNPLKNTVSSQCFWLN